MDTAAKRGNIRDSDLDSRRFASIGGFPPEWLVIVTRILCGMGVRDCDWGVAAMNGAEANRLPMGRSEGTYLFNDALPALIAEHRECG